MSRLPPVFNSHPVSYSDAVHLELTRAICQNVSDGDTVDCLLDLGWYHYAYVVLRLRGVDTPELVGTTGAMLATARRAAARTRDLALDQPVLVRSFKHRTSFGRFVADIYVAGANINTNPADGFDIADRPWTSLSAILTKENLAVELA